MANTYLQRTTGGSPTNATIWTFSAWIKRSSLSTSTSQKVFGAGSGSSDRTEFLFSNDGSIAIYRDISSSALNLTSTRKFRDVNAWYHFVIQNNNGTVAVYVNNEVVSLSSSTLGTNKINNASTVHYIGRQVAGGQNFDGSMSHIHFIDGTAYDATAFGEYDANGVWTINTSPSVTYGTNGFFILKNGNSVTDQSGNSNNFTVGGGTLTNTEDSPSNVFCTMNPLASESGITFSNGNLKTTSSTDGAGCGSTLAVKSGKWYFEVKYSDNANYGVGWGRTTEYTSSVGYTSTSYNIDEGGNKTHNSSSSNIFTLSGSNIIGFALDCDNQTIHFSQNGNWYNNNNSSTTLDPNNPDYSSVNVDEELFPIYSHFATSSASVEFNFGNGYFGTTAVASAGTNASGNGIFEFDVPTGYTALSTKGLNL